MNRNKQPDDIVVTGIGVISSIGNTKDTFWSNLTAGVSGAARIQAFDPEGFGTTFACEVKDFNPQTLMDRRRAKRMARFSQFATCASLEALSDSGLDLANEDSARIGCIIGTGAGDYSLLEVQHRTFFEKGPLKAHPLTVPQVIPNMAAGNAAIEMGINGPNFAAISACATGTHAVATAAMMIQCGQADIMFAGGAEATVSPVAVDAYGCMKVLSTRNSEPAQASRPFDRDRDGFVMGEGAGILVLEKREHAEKRGARIYAVLAGSGMTSDAFSIAAPRDDGRWAAAAMKTAMQMAGLNPEDIGYINAHGTSTHANDITETRAIKEALGNNAYDVPVSSIKSMIGHALGAAGGIEAAVSALSLYHGVLPPTINLETPDPECDLDYIPGSAREIQAKAVLSNSFGFGGHNGVLAFTQN